MCGIVKSNEYKNLTVEKINDSKFNRLLKMQKLNYIDIYNENDFLKDLNICKKTLRKWKKKMTILEKMKKITVDRALQEMIFTDKSQIDAFNYLKEDVNWFSTWTEVNKEVKISRYFFRIVKKYMLEEVKNIND